MVRAEQVSDDMEASRCSPPSETVHSAGLRLPTLTDEEIHELKLLKGDSQCQIALAYLEEAFRRLRM
jgi:hypothetical protein